MERNTPRCIRQPFAETKKRHSRSKLLIREESDPESGSLTMGFNSSGMLDCQQPQNTYHLPVLGRVFLLWLATISCQPDVARFPRRVRLRMKRELNQECSQTPRCS